MSRVDVDVTDLYGGSLWLQFLYERLGRWLTVPGACLLWAVAQAGVFISLSAAQGTLLIDFQEGKLNLLQDTTALAYYLLLPLCFLLLYYTLRLFRRYLLSLNQYLEPSSPPDAHDNLVAEARRAFSPERMRRVRMVLFALGSLVVLTNAVTNLNPGFFYGSAFKWDGIAYPVSFVAARLHIAFVWGYAVPTWVAEVYMQIIVMARLNQTMANRGWLRVSPYALDRFGGLKGLARSASYVGYLILAAGVLFLAPWLRWVIWLKDPHVGDYAGLALYVVFASAGVALPVYLLHRILTVKRTEMLNFLNSGFEAINARVTKLMATNDVQGLGDENLGRALETVDRLHSQWSTLPNWPLSMSIVIRFVATVVIPAVGYWAVSQGLKLIPTVTPPVGGGG